MLVIQLSKSLATSVRLVGRFRGASQTKPRTFIGINGNCNSCLLSAAAVQFLPRGATTIQTSRSSVVCCFNSQAPREVKVLVAAVAAAATMFSIRRRHHAVSLVLSFSMSCPPMKYLQVTITYLQSAPPLRTPLLRLNTPAF